MSDDTFKDIWLDCKKLVHDALGDRIKSRKQLIYISLLFLTICILVWLMMHLAMLTLTVVVMQYTYDVLMSPWTEVYLDRQFFLGLLLVWYLVKNPNELGLWAQVQRCVNNNVLVWLFVYGFNWVATHYI